MSLTNKDFDDIRKELDECKRPLFFFHDDPDGLASFLLLYRYCKKGYGVIVKSDPKVDDKFLRKVEEYMPDKIFVLDIALMEQSFADNTDAPIIWIDHHQPLNVSGTKYFNPRISNLKDNHPVSYLCYQVTKKDLWIAMTGCIGDWFLPDFSEDFSKKYPDLLPEVKTADEAMFNSRLGELVSIFSFILKGKTKDVMQCIKILTRIDEPYEILEQKTAQGKFIYRRYSIVNEKYQTLLKHTLKQKSEDGIFIFIYKHAQISFTKDLANELLFRNPNKLIVIGRERTDEIKLSLRSRKIKLPSLVKSSLKGLDGYGGGHEHACGVTVKKNDFGKFLSRFRKAAGV